MKPLSIDALAELAGGKRLGTQGARHAVRVCTDSRKVQPGDLFVALKGEHFDGHDYVMQVAQSGAVAAMISDPAVAEKLNSSLGLILVPDTLVGLQEMAAAYRRTLSLKVIAVTGSNGKTSTKDYLAAVLSSKFKTHKTTGNLNNHIGVPLTLMELSEEDEWAVVEMGMNHPGELDILMKMAQPDWAVITKIGWAHIEAFADQQGIAAEKASVIRGLEQGGRAFLNGDDEHYPYLCGQTKGKVISVGSGEDMTLRLKLESLTAEAAHFSFQTKDLEKRVTLPAPAWHMVQNAGLAIAVGLEAGVSAEAVVEALARVDTGKNRLHLEKFRDGYLINDTYNASPDSVEAAFQMLEKLPVPGRRVVLLGSMGELGAYSDRLHEEIGRKAIESGVELLYTFGFAAEKLLQGAVRAGATAKHARSFDSHEVLYNFYESTRLSGDVILVKGSRSQRMERVVEMLLQSEQRGEMPCLPI
jgi:UDP-N-acetylmuramoyl-tripeptide--D-alanyl-D-alanine ligase